MIFFFFVRASQWQMPAWTHKGVSRGECPPQKLENFCIFETEIVQFGEYFLAQIKAGNE